MVCSLQEYWSIVELHIGYNYLSCFIIVYHVILRSFRSCNHSTEYLCITYTICIEIFIACILCESLYTLPILVPSISITLGLVTSIGTPWVLAVKHISHDQQTAKLMGFIEI